MKNIKKFISVLLVLVTLMSVCSLPVGASEPQQAGPQNFDEYREMLLDEGIPTMSTPTFLQITRAIDIVYRVITLQIFSEKEYFNFNPDETIIEICDTIKEGCDLDILMLVGDMPSLNTLPKFVTETFDIDTATLREELFRIRRDYDEQGNQAGGIIFYFLGVYMSVIEECQAYCDPLDDQNNYEIRLRIVTQDGFTEDLGTGVMVNTETGIVGAKQNDNGILATGFNFSIPELLLYAQVNAWMRDFGFCFGYDLFCYLTPLYNYHTRRIKFDYEGMEWMIQIWKGNYLISNGAEVGIYTREPGSFGTYYDCANDEQMMKMGLKLYKGDTLLFERPEQLHWWQTGFKLSSRVYTASQLTLDFTIELKDEAMLAAFCEAVDNHYMHDMTYTVDGLKVNVVW